MYRTAKAVNMWYSKKKHVESSLIRANELQPRLAPGISKRRRNMYRTAKAVNMWYSKINKNKNMLSHPKLERMSCSQGLHLGYQKEEEICLAIANRKSERMCYTCVPYSQGC